MLWSDSVDDLDLALACEGATHRLRWHRGEVLMLDHPDAESELALVALGGAEPVCLSMTKLWDEAVADGGFLEEWVDDAHLDRARLSWLGMALERLRNEGFHEFLRSLPPARAEKMGRFLHSFPRPWLDRASAAVAAAAIDGEGVECAQARPLITVAISQRVRRAFVASLGQSQLSLGAAALVPLRVAVMPVPSAPNSSLLSPEIAGRIRGPGRAVDIMVDECWLHRVWAAGAEVIDGHLVLALQATEANGSSETVSVTVVEWVDGAPTLVRRAAVYDSSGWSLSARPN